MMLMEEYKISEAIYAESLVSQNYRISDNIYEETINLSEESLRQELSSSFKLSGKYWVWKLASAIYEYRWKRMLAAHEMQMPAKGFKYFLSYPDVASLQMAYFEKNGSRGLDGIHKVGKGLDLTKPAAYYAFSRQIRKGDVILVVGPKARLVAWGQVNSDYMYRPTRAYGRHYRMVSWSLIDMPFVLTNKAEYLYQLPNEDVGNLKEMLVDQLYLVKNSLPFGFVSDSEELAIPFDVELPLPTLQAKHSISTEQDLVLGQIVGALLRAVR